MTLVILVTVQQLPVQVSAKVTPLPSRVVPAQQQQSPSTSKVCPTGIAIRLLAIRTSATHLLSNQNQIPLSSHRHPSSLPLQQPLEISSVTILEVLKLLRNLLQLVLQVEVVCQDSVAWMTSTSECHNNHPLMNFLRRNKPFRTLNR